jgi:flavin reductase (DIM6/NTAB) family NADH-FMN oxidoreductase RutF
VPVDLALFRQAAASFASGVTIVTTGSAGEFHGMTASAFTSLSLNPTLVLVCIDRTADTLPVLQKTGRFNVSVLAAGQEELSRQFATKNSPESNGLHGVDYYAGDTGLPLISGAIAYFECRTLYQYDGGDHVIFAGEVEAAGANPDDQPLLYFRGHYRRLAPLA